MPFPRKPKLLRRGRGLSAERMRGRGDGRGRLRGAEGGGAGLRPPARGGGGGGRSPLPISPQGQAPAVFRIATYPSAKHRPPGSALPRARTDTPLGPRSLQGHASTVPGRRTAPPRPTRPAARTDLAEGWSRLSNPFVRDCGRRRPGSPSLLRQPGPEAAPKAARQRGEAGGGGGPRGLQPVPAAPGQTGEGANSRDLPFPTRYSPWLRPRLPTAANETRAGRAGGRPCLFLESLGSAWGRS